MTRGATCQGEGCLFRLQISSCLKCFRRADLSALVKLDKSAPLNVRNLCANLSKLLSACRDQTNFCFGARDDLLRQRRVQQILRERLAVMNSPPQKINKGFAFGRVLLILISENVREA